MLSPICIETAGSLAPLGPRKINCPWGLTLKQEKKKEKKLQVRNSLFFNALKAQIYPFLLNSTNKFRALPNPHTGAKQPRSQVPSNLPAISSTALRRKQSEDERRSA